MSRRPCAGRFTCWFLLSSAVALTPAPALAQADDFSAVRASVDFGRPLAPWDGFGFNYVELTQTPDPAAQPQDYGGFSLLDDSERKQVLALVFGEEGLKPGLVKMFLDPFHQKEPGGPFDHLGTTRNMLAFVQEGERMTRARGDALSIVTTLYGPPGWATRQKVVRGRDFDPAMKKPLLAYLADWARFLKKDRKLPVAYVSLHNEGEDWVRWSRDGHTEEGVGHDYNMYWPPELVVDFLRALPAALRAQGLGPIGVTPGETFSLDRFHQWGYADAIADDAAALRGTALITSHGFFSFGYGRWNGRHVSSGFDILRARKPGLHAWITSTSWADMDARFVWQLWSHIYFNKVNGIIPWAGIQRPQQWSGGDPNPGAAFHVSEDGRLTQLAGYFHFKQVSRAGQPGMAVARTSSMDPQVSLMAFARGRSRHPDAFVIINIAEEPRPLVVSVRGTRVRAFAGFRTVDAPLPSGVKLNTPERRRRGLAESYQSLGAFTIDGGGQLRYTAPAESVTTFFADAAAPAAQPK